MNLAEQFHPVPKPQHKRNKPTQKQRGAISPSVRLQLAERSNLCCEACGRSGVPLQAAHTVRRWRLPKTTVNDLAHLCVECHMWADSCKEGRKWLEQFRELLKLKESQ